VQDMAIGLRPRIGDDGYGRTINSGSILLWRVQTSGLPSWGRRFSCQSSAATITNANFGRIDVLDAAVVGVACRNADRPSGRNGSTRLSAPCLAVILIGQGPGWALECCGRCDGGFTIVAL
jgi:hypothetical protein